MPPGRKKTKNLYWTAETEEAIVLYNNTIDQDLRNKIYEDKLHAPLSKMVEYIFNTFKFSYYDQGPKEFQIDALTYVVSKMHLFDPLKGKGRSFGYFSLAAKNYFIWANNNRFKNLSRNVDIMEDDEYEHGKISALLIDNNLPSEQFDKIEKHNELQKWWNQYFDVVFCDEMEITKEIGHYVLDQTFNPTIENKGELYNDIRLKFNVSSKIILEVLQIIRPYMRKINKMYQETGYIDYHISMPIQSLSNRLDEKTILNIKQDWMNGTRQIDLINNYKKSKVTIYNLLTGRMYGNINPPGFIPLIRKRKERLNALDVIQIKEKYQKGNVTYKDLAEIYNVNISTIRLIIAGRTWKNVQMPKLKDLIILIKNDWMTGKFTQKDLRIKYNISRSKMHQILTGKTYKHINPPGFIFHQSVKIRNGSSNGCSKLTEEQVIEIREKYNNNRVSCLRLGKEYGVHPTTIYLIVSGRKWKSILPDNYQKRKKTLLKYHPWATIDTILQIRKMHAEGIGVSKIAETVGLPWTTVRYILWTKKFITRFEKLINPVPNTHQSLQEIPSSL